MIEVVEVRKSFAELKAVDGITFAAGDGEITGLLGPNGAGKTTTLRMLCTLIKPDHGIVRVDGVDAVADPLAVRKRLGVLPDAHGLYTRLTARENIDYFGRLQGLADEQLRERREALIAGLEMTDFADRRCEGLSRGQRVKTGIARALVHAPHNVILDEPSNGLDVMSTRALRRFLRQLKAEGHCVLLSSHVMQEVTALCDRVVVVARGRVVGDGTPNALRALTGEDNLEDAFVKLIGSEEGLLA